jgi:phytoene synthase
MPLEDDESFAEEIGIALAYTPQPLRTVLAAFFAFDQRLGKIVGTASEPMLAQVKLAWWRDMLTKPVDERPQGDAVLDALGRHWIDKEAALGALVDGWEHLLEEPPLTKESAIVFGTARMNTAMAAFGQNIGPGGELSSYGTAAWRWAIADLASKVSNDEERKMLVDIGMGNAKPAPALPREARGLAVLGAVGLRALKRGGRPLMEGRGAALTAIRAGLIGR